MVVGIPIARCVHFDTSPVSRLLYLELVFFNLYLNGYRTFSVGSTVPGCLVYVRTRLSATTHFDVDVRPNTGATLNRSTRFFATELAFNLEILFDYTVDHFKIIQLPKLRQTFVIVVGTCIRTWKLITARFSVKLTCSIIDFSIVVALFSNQLKMLN